MFRSIVLLFWEVQINFLSSNFGGKFGHLLQQVKLRSKYFNICHFEYFSVRTIFQYCEGRRGRSHGLKGFACMVKFPTVLFHMYNCSTHFLLFRIHTNFEFFDRILGIITLLYKRGEKKKKHAAE